MPLLDIPMAMELDDVTLTLTGSFEARTTSGSGDGNTNGADLTGSFRVSAEVRFPNRSLVEANHPGQHFTNLTPAPTRTETTPMTWRCRSEPTG